jgi:hypothetical protein
MAMYHYSVSYYLARSVFRMREEPVFPEDVFALLDACGDNVNHFFRAINQILQDFGKCQIRSLNHWPQGPFNEVSKYRDVILHNPVLGRVNAGAAESIPKCEYLEDVKNSWRQTEELKPEQFISLRDLYKHLHVEVISFLQKRWTEIMHQLDSLREEAKFKKQWSLEKLLPIGPPGEPISLYQPIALSGNSYPPPASPVGRYIILSSNCSSKSKK